MDKIVGRKKDQEALLEALNSSNSEMIAVIGRRRVGKTFLIRSTYENQIDFEITGAQNAPLNEQLFNFQFALKQITKKDIKPRPENWMEAFVSLIDCLEEDKSNRKKVLFFDELPWLATRKSGFLRALGFFWNSWAVKNNVVLVICGSAASWMIQKVVNHKGGLHNRITKRIFLKPFTLAETEEYLRSKNNNLDRYQILQIYMAMGGIPHYLNEIKIGKSAIQNIDKICFSEGGLLTKEFDRLYPALFENSENHIAIIRTLASKHKGLTRKEIVGKSKMSNGGGLTKVLEELKESGFISRYRPFGKKKNDFIYRLTDEYSLFYLRFIEDNLEEDEAIWQKLSQTQSYKTWSGYAYENICLKHIKNIKKTLEIGGIYSQTSSFYKKGTDESKGAQIDLVIDRNDQVVNLCEIKFYNQPYTLSKAEANNIRNKMWTFQEHTKTRKQLFFIMITTFGLVENGNSLGLISGLVVLEDLF